MSIFYAIRPASPAAHLFHVTCRVEQPDPAGPAFHAAGLDSGQLHDPRVRAQHRAHQRARRRSPRRSCKKSTSIRGARHPRNGSSLPTRCMRGICRCAQRIWMKRTDFSTARRCFCCRSACTRALHGRHPAAGRCALSQLASGYRARAGTRHSPPRFGTYEAANYDELIDCPVEMGDFRLGAL